MTKVLLTGADGFTGRYMAAELHQAGYEVIGLVRKPLTSPLPGLTEAHVADLDDAARLGELMKLLQPEMVVHLAAIAFVAHGDADAMYRTNLLGTRRLLEALCASGRPPRAVLLASSANIYGNSREGALDETTPAAPANDYAVSKLAMEYMARLYAERLPLIITRPFNYTGVGQASNFLLPKIVGHVRRRAELIELGNIDVARDFSDVRLVVASYRRLLECPAAIGGTFNVCSGQEHTLSQVLAMACAIAGHSMEVRVNPAFVRANEVRVLKGSRALLESVIGPVADIPLTDTLRWMIEANA